MAHGTCSVEGCPQVGRLRRGWCAAHYGRWQKTGDLQVHIPVKRTIDPTGKGECAEDGCGRPVSFKGLCDLHYNRRFEERKRKARPPKVPRTCEEGDCGRPHYGHGMCQLHYRRKRDERDHLPKPAEDTCTAAACSRLRTTRGYCGFHYQRLRAYGDADWQPTTYAVCQAADCSKPPRSPRSPLCEPHLARLKLYGTLDHGTCKTCGDRFTKQSRPDRRRCTKCELAYMRDRRRDIYHRRRAIKRDSTAERFSSLAIYERDRWRCGLCRKRVSRKLEHPHPMSASLDHKLPLSLGGSHTRANVQLAHLRCNLSKCNRGAPEQLALIG